MFFHKQKRPLAPRAKGVFVLEAGLEPAWPQWPKDFKSFVSTIPPFEQTVLWLRFAGQSYTIFFQYARFRCVFAERSVSVFAKNLLALLHSIALPALIYRITAGPF